MKILITGASGQVGAELKDLLTDRKDVVAVFADRNILPLEDTLSIQQRLAKYSPDIIIHAGAYTAVDKAESEPELAGKVNHLATQEIARYCKQHGAKLIAISTDYVFDGNSSSPLTENATVNPINIYGETKLKGEEAIQAECPEAIIIRTAWVYSTYGNNFVKTMLRLMTEREEIAVINDQVGSPTYALDLAKAIMHIVDYPKWKAGIYHYSNTGEISWYDFALVIREVAGLDCKINAITSSEFPTAAKRPKFSLLDKSKIMETFGLQIPFWKDSLRLMLEKCLK